MHLLVIGMSALLCPEKLLSVKFMVGLFDSVWGDNQIHYNVRGRGVVALTLTIEIMNDESEH